MGRDRQDRRFWLALGVTGGQTRQKLSAGLIPHVDADVVTTSRAVNGWTLDRERLAAAIRANAPHVQLRVIEQLPGRHGLAGTDQQHRDPIV